MHADYTLLPCFKYFLRYFNISYLTDFLDNSSYIYCYFLLLLFFSGCPSITLPISPDLLTCQGTEYCTGLQCCIALDIEITQLFLNAWLAIDPCDFELSIGLGTWTYNKTLLPYDWGVEKALNVGNSLQVV